MQVFTHFTANNIKIKPMPFHRELLMEAYLIDNADVLALDNKNYCDVDIIGAELSLRGGRPSKDTDGRIDILATYHNEVFAIIELKCGELGDSHLTQLEDYLSNSEQIDQLISDYVDQDESSDKVHKMGILVGESISLPLAKKIQDGYQFKNKTGESIVIAALTLQRFRDENKQIYVWTNSYFKSNSRDFSQYPFKNQLYGKGRFVLAVIKAYVEDHPQVSFSELASIFPKAFTLHDNAESIMMQSGRKRHFLNTDELIKLADGSIIAVSSQWGINNFSNFYNESKKLYPKLIVE